MTIDGLHTTASGDIVRAALTRGAHPESDQDNVNIVTVETVEILEEQASTTSERLDRTSFYDSHDLDTLAAEQAVRPARDFESLLGDFWPDEEHVDEFVAAIRARRRDTV